MQQYNRFLLRLKVLGIICVSLLLVALGSYLSGMARRRVWLPQFDPALDPGNHLNLVQKSSGGREMKKCRSVHSTTIAEVSREPLVEMQLLIWIQRGM